MDTSDVRLKAELRTITGKKVKNLRPQGLVPGAVSRPEGTLLIQFPLKGHERLLAGSGLITLEVQGRRPQQVLLKHVAKSSRGNEVLHADFMAVAADRKITSDVPLIFQGTAPVEQSENAVVMRQLETVQVSCLPGDLPTSIVIDMEQFTELKQTYTVADLAEIPGVTFVSSPEAVIVTITAPQLPEPEPEVETAEETEEGAEEASDATPAQNEEA